MGATTSHDSPASKMADLELPLAAPERPLVHNPHHVGQPATEADRVVVIAVDQSRQADTAFEWYARHMHKPGNVVRIIHCQDMMNIAFLPEIKPERLSLEFDEQRQLSRQIIEKYSAKLRQKELRGSVFVDIGPPGDTVVNYANDNKASMIVMGSRGYGVIRRTVMGSVSQYVVSHSHVPVTVVPKETREDSLDYSHMMHMH